MKNLISKKSILLVAGITLLICSTVFLTAARGSKDGFNASSTELAQANAFIEILGGYLEIGTQFFEVADDNDKAAAFAVMEIKSLYEDEGKPEVALKEYESLLKKVDSQPVRNMIRFNLHQILKDSGETDDAIKNLRILIEENS